MRYIIELTKSSKYAVERDETDTGWIFDISKAKRYTEQEIEEIMSYTPNRRNLNSGDYKIHEVEVIE